MADPNTQIDWWIAQTWQEAQGGADADALVVWLHENGLTALSSYTILQAALSCKPEEAKEMVFGHPIWAGEDLDPDVANLDYTNETLEPEPEPDPSFELDDWADHLEEDGPVYGEEGYEPDPDAGVSLPAKTSAEPALNAYNQPDTLEQPGGFGETDDLEEEPFESFEADSEPLPEPESAPMDTIPLAVEPLPEPAETFETDIPSMPAPEPEPEPAPTDTMPLAAEAELEPVWEAPPTPILEPELPPAPAVEAQKPAAAPAPPPILRTPPSTPAERAAVFAGAFGKKPAAAAAPASATAEAPSTPPGAVPPSTDMGPAEEAETSPAHSEIEQPHPTMATAPTPPPLVYEPLPKLEVPQPLADTEPLFSTPHHPPQPSPPLFPAVESLHQSADPELPKADAETPEAKSATDGNGYDEQAVGGEDELEETDTTKDMVPETPTDEPEELHEVGVTEFRDDLPPGMAAAMESSQADSGSGTDEPHEEVDTDLPAINREQEFPPLGEEEEEEEEEEEDVEADPGEIDYPPDGEPVEDANRRRKKVLLDPLPEEPDDVHPEELPISSDPDDMAVTAMKLGINFRGPDPTEIGVDPETVGAARKLGISFREGDDALEPDLDETALAAQKLGISFREDGLTSDKPRKPMIVKYMPFIFVVVITFFLVLLGVTFAGDAAGWLRDSGLVG